MRTTYVAFIAGLFLSAPLWANEHQHHAMSSPAAPTPMVYQASGVVKQWDTQSVTLSHGPITDLHWPAMTMAFKLPDPFGEFKPLPVNTPVAFSFIQSDSGYTLTSITPQQ
ncbi:copper-binding protein [Brenneria goodwinii]|uniref:copper-binding protein n=1 Tax=Brenneria goodwinii TaxID=1109412 RepID=UPI000EF1E33E|nr:copper-binding protein [Brenneria goodwinii]MCG8156845.1 copper-binding protein [Brenneria goodwinii]MCG8163487.1 copper-binding protein [Brenneria goodwinii]MCG8165681.1 copper-binding protein [Brenneria goodwinii]MCG8170169.1 copper-binding protein [Brenneria goodwinii]MCG8174379.1 copper-binding protein [Brenneria goodwinii]